MHILRVLLVEDNDGDAALVASDFIEKSTGSMLSPFVDLARVGTLAEAREKLANGPTDAVLLDLALPDSLGIETLTAVRLMTDAPIVILTGLTDEETALTALKSGAQDYMVKGDTGHGVLRALRYARERKAQEDELRRSRWLAGIGDTVLAVLHEINNPLTSLLMNAEMLASGDREPDTVRAILASARRIAEVTRRLSQQQLQPRTVEYVKGLPMLDLGDDRRRT